MRVLSVNVGLPRTMTWEGKAFESGICKSPVAGRVAVRRLNLEGDGQADLVNHGGALQAVYVYPFEHYEPWRSFLGREIPMGAFGENLTVEGLDESVGVGDRIGIGSAEFVVTTPRVPCYKFAALHGRGDVVDEMLRTGRSGYYLAVTRQGEVGAGDAIVLLERGPCGVRVADLAALLIGPVDGEILARAAGLETISDGWRRRIARGLAAQRA